MTVVGWGGVGWGEGDSHRGLGRAPDQRLSQGGSGTVRGNHYCPTAKRTNMLLLAGVSSMYLVLWLPDPGLAFYVV